MNNSKNGKKYSLTKRLHYLLDDFVSRGFWAQLILLAGIASILVVIFGIILAIFEDEQNISNGIWESLMHMIDQGTITGDEERSDSFLRIMLVLTFIGMAFTSAIIGIINSSISENMYKLRKGHSAIIEKDHVVILGFNENTYTISHEIAESGTRSRTRDCIVIADDIPKEDMEHYAKDFQPPRMHFYEKIPDRQRRFKESRIIFRSGDLISENTFRICAAELSRAVVINSENDLETIRIILALISYLRRSKAYISDDYMPSIVALISDDENLTAAKSAAGILHERGQTAKQKNEHKIRILSYRSILENLFAQACIHPGLPLVLDSLFNSYAASICIEKDIRDKADAGSVFIGKSLPQITENVTGAIPIGFARTDEYNQIHVLLNPGKDKLYGENDRLIYLSDNNKLETGQEERPEPVGRPAGSIRPGSRIRRHFLLIGLKDALPGFVGRMKDCCLEGSSVDIIADEAEEYPDMDNIRMECRLHRCRDPYRFSKVRAVLDEHPEWFDPDAAEHLTNIVIFSDDSLDKTQADEKVTVLLLNIRQYLENRCCGFISITSEMFLPKDQVLMQNNSGNDFVVASEISNRMMVQIAGDPRKYYVIEDMLRQKSAAISLKYISEYMDVSVPFNFEGVFRQVKAGGEISGIYEIPVGWIYLPEDAGDEDDGDKPVLILNPSFEELSGIIDPGEVNDFDRYRLVVITGKEM